MDTKEIEYILSLLKKNDVTEFDLTRDGNQIKIKRGQVVELSATVAGAAYVNHGSQAAASAAGSVAGPASAASAESAAGKDNFVKVDSPIVGTFYRRPTPDAEPFAREGDVIKKGQTLCIIEAMKLMNEIVAPCSGRVDKVLLADGQVVEYGEVMFLIEPDS